MGTRGNITVILKEEDLRKKRLSFNKGLLGPMAEANLKGVKFKPVDVESMGENTGIRVYVQFDAYPDGVGKELLYYYNTYEKALNLVVGGSLETLSTYENSGSKVCGGWMSILQSKRTGINLHEFVRTDAGGNGGFSPFEEFSYLFKDGKWYVMINDTCGYYRNAMKKMGLENDINRFIGKYLPLEDVIEDKIVSMLDEIESAADDGRQITLEEAVTLAKHKPAWYQVKESLFV